MTAPDGGPAAASSSHGGHALPPNRQQQCFRPGSQPLSPQASPEQPSGGLRRSNRRPCRPRRTARAVPGSRTARPRSPLSLPKTSYVSCRTIPYSRMSRGAGWISGRGKVRPRLQPTSARQSVESRKSVEPLPSARAGKARLFGTASVPYRMGKMARLCRPGAPGPTPALRSASPSLALGLARISHHGVPLLGAS